MIKWIELAFVVLFIVVFFSAYASLWTNRADRDYYRHYFWSAGLWMWLVTVGLPTALISWPFWWPLVKR